MRPPKLNWDGSHATGARGGWIIQSEIVRGEPRIYYAILNPRGFSKKEWQGHDRATRRQAEIDAEYYDAGRFADRPRSKVLAF